MYVCEILCLYANTYACVYYSQLVCTWCVTGHRDSPHEVGAQYGDWFQEQQASGFTATAGGPTGSPPTPQDDPPTPGPTAGVPTHSPAKPQDELPRATGSDAQSGMTAAVFDAYAHTHTHQPPHGRFHQRSVFSGRVS